MCKRLPTKQRKVKGKLLSSKPLTSWSAVTVITAAFYHQMWKWVSLGEVEAIEQLQVAQLAQAAKAQSSQAMVNLKKVIHEVINILSRNYVFLDFDIEKGRSFVVTSCHRKNNKSGSWKSVTSLQCPVCSATILMRTAGIKGRINPAKPKWLSARGFPLVPLENYALLIPGKLVSSRLSSFRLSLLSVNPSSPSGKAPSLFCSNGRLI